MVIMKHECSLSIVSVKPDTSFLFKCEVTIGSSHYESFYDFTQVIDTPSMFYAEHDWTASKTQIVHLFGSCFQWMIRQHAYTVDSISSEIKIRFHHDFLHSDYFLLLNFNEFSRCLNEIDDEPDSIELLITNLLQEIKALKTPNVPIALQNWILVDELEPPPVSKKNSLIQTIISSRILSRIL